MKIKTFEFLVNCEAGSWMDINYATKQDLIRENVTKPEDVDSVINEYLNNIGKLISLSENFYVKSSKNGNENKVVRSITIVTD